MSGIHQILLGGSQAPAVDPFFYSVTSLLHGDGTNGGQNNTFLDSSTNNFTITRNGNTTQGSFSPFSQTGWSNFVTSGSSRISVSNNAAFGFGTGDFTVEFWLFYTGGNGYKFFFSNNSGSGNYVGYGLQNGTLTPWVWNNTDVLVGSSNVALNTWQHHALVRNGNTLTIYLNGVSIGSTTWTVDLGSSKPFYIGWNGGNDTQTTDGYISNFRVVKGTAVYTSAFTPPTTPLTAITSTSLLTCQNNRFIDNSSNNFAITVSGSTSIQAFSPFNPTTAYSTSAVGGSAYFDGSGDRIMTASTSAAFDLGSGNWTIEAWVYFTTVTSYATIAYCSLSNVDGHGLTLVTTSAFAYYINGSLAINSGVAPVAGRWYHVAAVRNSGTTTLYVNGVSTGTTASAPTSKNYYFSSGLKPNDIEPLTGYVSDARVVKGTAVYTANFTPPTAPLTAIANTSILCNFTNGAIFDNAAVADYETVGNAQISTSVKKYGTGSMYFDGTGDWLASPLTESLKYGTGDLTIEGWFYNSASQQSASGLFSYLAGSTYFVLHNNTGTYPNQLTLWVDGYSASPVIVGGVTIAQSVWYHFALTRTAGVWKLYLNGTQIGSSYTNSAEPVPANSQFRLALGNNSGSAGGYTGYIDDFRISKGISRYPYNFTPPTAEFPNIGGTVTLTADPYYDYTTLLLPGNGTNGAQNNTFLDSSTNNFTITRNGNTTQGTFSPFSQTGWGNFFDGSGDYLTAPNNAAFDFGSGDFTIELWFYPTTVSGFQGFCGKRANSPSYGPLSPGINNGAVWLLFSTSGSSWAVNTTGGTLVANQWYHVAIVRSGTSLKAYLNGTEIISTTLSGALVSNSVAFSVGSMAADGGDPFSGYISNFRAVKGTAVYTSNFTPSTTPLTAISGTSLLTCQSNRFIDNSTNAFAITAAGNVSVQAFSPFNPTAAWSAATNGGSGYFDGSGDYLSLADNAAFNMGTGNFTAEFWLYTADQTNNYPGIISASVFSDTGAISVRYDNTGNANKIFVYLAGASPSDPLVTSSAYAFGQWIHVAIVRDSTTALKIYVNGTLDGTGTITSGQVVDFSGANSFYIGRGFDVDGGAAYLAGYISSVRLVKGTAVYTGNFTPPTGPLTAIANTSFLCNFTNAGIYDATSKNDLETVGNAQISTAQSKFGGSSMYFDGVGDWLIMPTGPNLVLGTGDFTIECWLRPGSQVGSNNSFVGSNASGGPILNLIGSGTSTSIAFNAYGSANIFNISYTFTQNTWVHVAVARYGTSLKLFINGIQTGSTVTDSTNFSGFLRTVGMADNGNQIYVGYIQDLRITKGIARYTSNFTPPTTAFLTL